MESLCPLWLQSALAPQRGGKTRSQVIKQPTLDSNGRAAIRPTTEPPSCPADADETINCATQKSARRDSLSACLSATRLQWMQLLCVLTTSHTLGPVPNEPKGNGVIDLSGSRGRPFAALWSSNTSVSLWALSQERRTWSQGVYSWERFLWHVCVCWAEPAARFSPALLRCSRGLYDTLLPGEEGFSTTTSPEVFCQDGFRTQKHRGHTWATRPHLTS